MTLKMIFSVLLSLSGVIITLLGVIFLIASKGIASRLITGITLSLSGITVIYLGTKYIRKYLSISPEGIKKRLIKLAKMNHGEVSEDMITGEFGEFDAAEEIIKELVLSGAVTKTERDKRVYYIFPDLKMKIILKQCPYCGNDYPVREDIEKCPSCGGDLKMNKSILFGKDERYSMDE